MRVLIVDDDAEYRQWLRVSLSTDTRFEVIGEAENGAEAVARASELAPDLVLMDILMPGMNGLEATTGINAACPDATVIVISGLSAGDEEAAGAAGRIKKSDFSVAALVDILDR